MRHFTDNYMGVDVGVSRHHTAVTVLRRREPPAGEEDGEPLLEVADMSRARGVPFTAVAREVRRILGALEGTTTVGVDATGPGEGLAQELLRQGVRCVAMRMGGSGQRVTRRGDRWGVPASRVYEVTYRLLVQRRLRLSPDHPLTPQLASEMYACVAEHTPAGNVRYEVLAPGSHGDLLVSLGIAALLHEEPYGAAVRAAERRGRQGNRQRRPGKRRLGNAARAVIEERLEASRREALEYMNRRLWEE